MDERARQRGFHALALREPRGAAVGGLTQRQHRQQFVRALLKARLGNAVQTSKVEQVLARGEPAIEARVVEQRADAMLALARSTGAPSTRIRPPCGFNTPAIMRKVVVLPAPLAPSSPVMAPSGAWNDRPLSAVTAPNVLCSSSTSIIPSSLS